MAKFFEDLFEEDIVTRGFPNAGLLKVKTSAKTPDGVSLVVNTKRTPKAVELVLEPKLEIPKRNVEFAAVLGTNNVYSGSVTLKDLAKVGSKVTVTAELTGNIPTYKLAASFKNDAVAVKTNAVLPGDGGLNPLVEASVAGAYEKKYLAGASVKYVPPVNDRKLVVDWAAAAAIRHNGTLFHAFATTNVASMLLGLGFFRQATANYKTTGNVSVDVKNVAGISVVIGDEYKLDNITSVKSRISVVAPPKAAPYDVRFAVAVKHALQPRFNVTVGADLNPRRLIGQNVGSDHSFGIEMELL